MTLKQSLRATEARLNQMQLRKDRERRFAEKAERARQRLLASPEGKLLNEITKTIRPAHNTRNDA